MNPFCGALFLAAFFIAAKNKQKVLNYLYYTAWQAFFSHAFSCSVKCGSSVLNTIA